MRGILGHFHLIGQKERRVLDLIMGHLHAVVETALQTELLLESARLGNWKAVEDFTHKVGELEMRADGIHRDAVVAISQGVFFSGTRDDFLNLMEKNDDIADNAYVAAKILSEEPIDARSFVILYEEPQQTLSDLFLKLKEAVQLLEESIQALAEDAQLAVSKSLLVEHAEEEADEIKSHLIKRLFIHKREFEVLTLLQLRDFVLRLDRVVDSAEDASDIVISLVAKAQA